MNWILVGALGASLAIALGAFGAHGLESRLSSADLALWETASRYLMYAALGLVLMGVLGRATPTPVGGAAAALATGAVVFSGTVAALALGGPRWLGAITPLGGVLMIAGWLLLAWASART